MRHDAKNGLRPPAYATSFRVTHGSTFAKDGLSKQQITTDNRDWVPEPYSSFAVSAKPVTKPRVVPPKVANRIRPGTAKPIVNADKPKSRSRSARRRQTQYDAIFSAPKINADLEIERLEKKREETKQELKSLLKRYLTDNQRAVFTAPPVRHAEDERIALLQKVDKLAFVLGEYGDACKCFNHTDIPI